MRKKIISLGLSVVTAGSIAFTAMAPAAHANIVTDVCNVLPGLQVSTNNSQASAQANANLTQSSLSSKDAALATATTSYVNALVAHLIAVAAGLPTAVTEANLTGATSDIGTKFVAWSAADAANYTAQQNLRVANMQKSIVDGLFSLPCVLP